MASDLKIKWISPSNFFTPPLPDKRKSHGILTVVDLQEYVCARRSCARETLTRFFFFFVGYTPTQRKDIGLYILVSPPPRLVRSC